MKDYAAGNGPVMPIYVVNLARSRDRLAHVAAQLAAQGLTFERIDAVDGNALPEEEFDSFVAARPRPNGLVWRRGQAGCFLSHVDVWQQLVAGSAPAAIVLEDDIRISEDLARFIHSHWVPSSADIVRIETTGQWLKLGDRLTIGASRVVARVRTTAWATGGYVITRAAAERLLATDPHSHMPVDAFLFDLERSTVARELVTMQMVPALVTQDKFDSAPGHGALFESEIEGDNAPPARGWLAMRRSVTSRLLGKTEIGFR